MYGTDVYTLGKTTSFKMAGSESKADGKMCLFSSERGIKKNWNRCERYFIRVKLLLLIRIIKLKGHATSFSRAVLMFKRNSFTFLGIMHIFLNSFCNYKLYLNHLCIMIKVNLILDNLFWQIWGYILEYWSGNPKPPAYHVTYERYLCTPMLIKIRVGVACWGWIYPIRLYLSVIWKVIL